LRADAALFISDLHLSPDSPATTERFLGFLKGAASRAARLYVLGDFFESWLGDDDIQSPLPATVLAALREQTDSGLDTGIMHGNRDFLIGPDFCTAAGCRMLADPTSIDLYGTPTLLLHGDSLCTDDQAYQAYRSQVRNPEWQRAILTLPLAERRALASQMRDASSFAKDGKSMIAMDVNADAVARAFREHACRRMIHGHTHRPGHHSHAVDGVGCERWVLPDWYLTGGYLLCDSAGCRAVALAA
jgi:UDP-2,3-diacylglucosamine hydrolase